MKIIKLGMIGSGHVSNRYFEQASIIEGVQVVATCSRHLENAKKKAETYGITRWYDDYRHMMDSEELDAVVVTTPHSMHAEPVLAALERGLHVMNEKPMATSFTDCKQMVSLAEEKGLYSNHTGIFSIVRCKANPYRYMADIASNRCRNNGGARFQQLIVGKRCKTLMIFMG